MPEVVKRINVLARRARQERVPVLFIQHEDPDDPEMTRDSPGWELATALDRLDCDPGAAHRPSGDGPAGSP